jgi:hypothetical protein
MRTTALFRWGLTSFLLAPLAILSWILSPSGAQAMQPTTHEVVVAIATSWGVFAPILAALLVITGALLFALAVRRGVRGVETIARGEWALAPPSNDPRIIVPPGWEQDHPSPMPSPRLSRRGLGAVLASGLLVWAAFIAWVLVAEHPRAVAGGGVPLNEVYATWNPVGQSGFIVAVAVWCLLATASVAAIVVLAYRHRVTRRRVLTERRFIALAAILASAIVVAAMPAYLTMGVSLPGDLAVAGGGLARSGASAGSWLMLQGGIAFSVLAILVTVPSWRRSSSRTG